MTDNHSETVVLSPRADAAKCGFARPDGLPVCPLQDRCARYLRPAAEYQWYSTFQHWRTERCEGFEAV